MITPKRPSGFNELLPADQLAFNAMISVIKLAYEQYGYAPIETPALELAEVLLAKEGGETAKQSYRFKKGDTDLAMRFDLTIPLARYTAEHYNDLVMPFRRYQIQEVWRGEKSQAGRYRQFYQCDVDIIGSSSMLADTDVLLTAHTVLKSLELNDAVLHISHRGIFNGWLENKKLTRLNTDVLRIIDKFDKLGEKKIAEEFKKVGLKPVDIKELIELAKIAGKAEEVIKKLELTKIKNSTFEKALIELKEIDRYLKAAGLNSKNYIFDLKIIRGLDYYTGMVFETFLTKNIAIGSICSGGRYDNLVGHYRKDSLPGVGSSIGLSRLFSAIKERLNPGPASPAQVVIIPVEEKAANYSLEVAQTLRRAGLNTLVYPGFDKVSKQLSYVNKLKIPCALLIGGDEEKKKTVTIKNMLSGKQSSSSLAKAASNIKKII